MDLVLFDELMKTVPKKSHILYVSLGQSAQYLATIAGPLPAHSSHAIWSGAGIMVSVSSA